MNHFIPKSQRKRKLNWRSCVDSRNGHPPVGWLVISRQLNGKCRARNGLSLLEVILSIAILGGSMVMIGNLYHLGYRSALQAQLRNDANIMASATMAELVAGITPIESTGETEIPGYPGWYFSIDIQDSLQPGLFMATVIVSRGDSSNSVPTSVSIVRFIPDPDYEPEEDEE